MLNTRSLLRTLSLFCYNPYIITTIETELMFRTLVAFGVVD